MCLSCFCRRTEVPLCRREIQKKKKRFSSFRTSKVFPSFGLLASAGLFGRFAPPLPRYLSTTSVCTSSKTSLLHILTSIWEESPRCVSFFSDAFRSRPPYFLQPSYRSVLSCRYLLAPLKVSVWKSWIDLRQATLEISRTQIYKGKSLPDGSFFSRREKEIERRWLFLD